MTSCSRSARDRATSSRSVRGWRRARSRRRQPGRRRWTQRPETPSPRPVDRRWRQPMPGPAEFSDTTGLNLAPMQKWLIEFRSRMARAPSATTSHRRSSNPRARRPRGGCATITEGSLPAVANFQLLLRSVPWFLGHVTWWRAVDGFRSVTMRDTVSAPIIVDPTRARWTEGRPERPCVSLQRSPS